MHVLIHSEVRVYNNPHGGSSTRTYDLLAEWYILVLPAAAHDQHLASPIVSLLIKHTHAHMHTQKC